MIAKHAKDPKLSWSYRPINSLSKLSKVAAAVILSRRYEAISEGNFLPDEEFGLREGLPTDFN